jgi:hypothetical protein
MPATAVPTAEDMLRIWRADRYVQDPSARNYLRWIKWFCFYAARHGLDERSELTQYVGAAHTKERSNGLPRVYPGRHHRDRGLGITFAQRVLGCRRSELERSVAGRLRLSDAERVTLGEIGHRLGRKALGEVATAAPPDTVLGRTGGSSPVNSMDRGQVEPRAGRQSAKKSRS